MEPRVGNKFRLGRKIGSGSFGEIYLGLLVISYLLWLSLLACVDYDDDVNLFVCFVGTNVQTNEEVAIKLVSIYLSVICRLNLIFIDV